MRLFAWDVESELIERGCLAPRIVCMSWMRDDSARPGLAGRGSFVDLLKSYLADPSYLLIGANVAFDFGVVIEHEPDLLPLVFRAYEEGRVRDVHVREQLLYIKDGVPLDVARDRIKLGVMAKRYLGHDLDKGADSWRYHYGDLMHTRLDDWPEEAKNYATSDAATTLGVYRKQAEKGIDGDLVSPDEKDQTRAAFALHLMGCWGLRTDEESILKLKASLEAEHAGHLAALQDSDIFHTTGSKKNPKRSKNMKAIKQRVTNGYTAQGLPVPETATGGVSYSEDVLRDSGDPVLIQFAESIESEKLLTSHVPILVQGISIPINPRWNVLVDTGRTSCSGPPVQQLPRKEGIRECFIPRRGNRYTNGDFNMAELCSLAQIHYSWFDGRSSLRDALLQGRDLHLDLAAQMLNIPYEEAARRSKAGDKQVKEYRQQAKPANFGYPGGMGAATFPAYAKSYGIHITAERGKEIRDLWFARWPEMREYFNIISRLTGDNGRGTMVQWGSGRVRGGVMFTQAANGFFQGLTADIAKEAMWETCRKCYAVPTNILFGSRPVAMMHDELLLESPADIDAECAEELAATMIEAANRWLKDIPSKVEPRVMSRWYKGAEAVRDENGRLIPYEPRKAAV